MSLWRSGFRPWWRAVVDGGRDAFGRLSMAGWGFGSPTPTQDFHPRPQELDSPNPIPKPVAVSGTGSPKPYPKAQFKPHPEIRAHMASQSGNRKSEPEMFAQNHNRKKRQFNYTTQNPESTFEPKDFVEIRNPNPNPAARCEGGGAFVSGCFFLLRRAILLRGIADNVANGSARARSTRGTCRKVDLSGLTGECLLPNYAIVGQTFDCLIQVLLLLLQIKARWRFITVVIMVVWMMVV